MRCVRVFDVLVGGPGREQLYCGRCKPKARTEHQRERRARRALRWEETRCACCGVAFSAVVGKGGRPKAYCTDRCSRRAWKVRKRAEERAVRGAT